MLNPLDTSFDPDLDLKVREVQIHHIYDQPLGSAFAYTVAVGLVVAALWSQVPAIRLTLWFGVTVLAQLVHLALVAAYKRQSPTGTDILRWYHFQAAHIALTALLWGMAMVVLWPAESELHQLPLTFIVMGMGFSFAVLYTFTWS